MQRERIIWINIIYSLMSAAATCEMRWGRWSGEVLKVYLIYTFIEVLARLLAFAFDCVLIYIGVLCFKKRLRVENLCRLELARVINRIDQNRHMRSIHTARPGKILNWIQLHVRTAERTRRILERICIASEILLVLQIIRLLFVVTAGGISHWQIDLWLTRTNRLIWIP